MAIDLLSLAWRAQRPVFRHGWLAWAVLGAAMLIGGQVAFLASSILRLTHQNQVPVVVAAVERNPQTVASSIPMPMYEQRFELTREAISAAAGATSGPMKISFAYQVLPEAHLIRQTATFATQSSWSELAPLLDRFQSVNRAAYISRLRVSRERIDQPLVDAEVQLAIAYLSPANAETSGDR